MITINSSRDSTVLMLRSNSTQLNLSLIIMLILHNSRKVVIVTFACFILYRARLKTNSGKKDNNIVLR